MERQTKYNPDPAYLRDLLAQAGITSSLAARILQYQGLELNRRAMRHYLSGRSRFPYAVQVAMEDLAENPPRKEDYPWSNGSGNGGA